MFIRSVDTRGNFTYVVADWKHLLLTAAEIISGAGAIKKYDRQWLWFGPVYCSCRYYKHSFLI
jgi:hypothetical protein